jgi:hypothetical protein
MPLIIDYSSFINSDSFWLGDDTNAPDQPYLYKSIAENITNLSSDDRTIIFANLPAGMTVLNPPETTAPYDSVFFDLTVADDYILLKNNFDGSWEAINENYEAAYTSSGYWGFGERTLPGNCILTGSGNASADIASIQWHAINASDDGKPAPSPFSGELVEGVLWTETIPNEIMTSYDVISPSGIQIRSTGAVGSTFNDIPRALRNLYVLFSTPV